MFRSARIKLTFFYLGILLVFSLLLTVGLRALTRSEIARANDAQRGAFHSIGQQFFESDDTPQLFNPDVSFARAQRTQDQALQDRLNRETILANIGVLVVGAAVSYWYAGRTLRPIEEAHERQKRFTSDASHELRTPLATMRLENEVFLRQKTFKEPAAREQLVSNLEEVDRLERLATNLLALDRYEHASLTRTPHKLADIVQDAVTANAKAVESRQAAIVQKAGKVRVLAERDSLVQLVTILIDNAVKYGPERGTVTLNARKQGDQIKLTVSDEGPGITETDLPHIFERMYRGDKARSSSVPGHGIGLSLAHEIARANGARLEAANRTDRSGGGAVFTLSVPAA